MPHYPKLLPWFAQRANVPLELAEKLWRRAVGDAAELAGGAHGPDFNRFAIERFIDLLEDECRPGNDAAPTSDWFWRHQRRMAAHSFKAANLTCSVWDRFWKNFRSGATFA